MEQGNSEADGECPDKQRRCMQGCSKCTFPFVHRGITYDTCTDAGIEDGEPTLDFKWCATEVDEKTKEAILMAECECVQNSQIIKARAKSETDPVLDVTFTQEDPLKIVGTITGLESSGNYRLNVYETTDAKDCSDTHGTPFEHPPLLANPGTPFFTELKVHENGSATIDDSSGFFATKIIDTKEQDCEASILRRVLVVEKEENKEDETEWNKVACATIQLVEDKTDWPVIYIIIVCVVVVFLIILAIILIICCRKRCCGKKGPDPEGVPSKPGEPLTDPLISSNGDGPGGKSPPGSGDLSSGNIPYIDELEEQPENVNRSITDLFFQKSRLQPQQSQESISNVDS